MPDDAYGRNRNRAGLLMVLFTMAFRPLHQNHYFGINTHWHYDVTGHTPYVKRTINKQRFTHAVVVYNAVRARCLRRGDKQRLDQNKLVICGCTLREYTRTSSPRLVYLLVFINICLSGKVTYSVADLCTKSGELCTFP